VAIRRVFSVFGAPTVLDVISSQVGFSCSYQSSMGLVAAYSFSGVRKRVASGIPPLSSSLRPFLHLADEALFPP